jgi:hypothetical protein
VAIRIFAVVAVLVGLIGCGGGGGGGTSTVQVSGRVFSVVTSGAPNPAAQFAVGERRVLTDPSDGSFTLEVPVNTDSATVDPRITGWPGFTFTFPAVTEDTDLGDLWIGPEKVTVRGRLLDASTGTAVSGGTVAFGGGIGQSGADGRFSLAGIAYSSENPSGFAGIEGAVRATNYFAASFSGGFETPVAGAIDIGDVLLVPLGSSEPPGTPYNVFGRVLPTALAAGARVEIRLGGVLVRDLAVGSDGRYYAWLEPGTYAVQARNGAQVSGVETVNLTQTNQVISRDVTFP